jgi:hypothetical protein
MDSGLGHLSRIEVDFFTDVIFFDHMYPLTVDVRI